MQLLKQSSIMVLRMMIERPGSTAGLVVFGLGFALIAGNALYSQEGSHPDPIWSTAKQQDSLSQNFEPEIARRWYQVSNHELSTACWHYS